MVGVNRDRIERAGIDRAVLLDLRRQDYWQYAVPERVWLSDEPTDDGPDPAAYPILEYRWGAPSEDRVFAGPGMSCLNSFIRLDEGPEAEFGERVVAFAKRWGPLGICRHGKPHLHRTPGGCSPLGSQVAAAGSAETGEPDYMYWEPLSAWARYVKQLSGLFSLGVELRQELPGRREDWEAVKAGDAWDRARSPYRDRSDGRNFAPAGRLVRLQDGTLGVGDLATEPLTIEFRSAFGASPEVQRALAAHAMDIWDQYGRVGAETIWPEAAPPYQRPTYAQLPGVLAIELRAALESEIEPARCYGCGRPTAPSRKPRYRNGVKRVWCKQSPECDAAAQVRAYRSRTKGDR